MARLSLATASDLFLDHLRVERHLSTNTLEAYSRDVTRLADHLPGPRQADVRKITAADIVRFLGSLATAGLAASSQARTLSAVRQLFAYLVREQHIVHNPCLDIEGPRYRRPLPVVPSQNDVSRVLAVPQGHQPRALRDRAALELLYAAGLRASELCMLRMDEVHMTLGVVRPRGKGAKERVVPLGMPARRALEAYLTAGRPKLLKGRQSVYVFIGNRQKPLSRMALYNLIRRCGLQAGVRAELSPHKLRHAFATHLLQGGADLRAVQEMLGHADIATTEIYTHVDTHQLKASVDKFHPLGREG